MEMGMDGKIDEISIEMKFGEIWDFSKHEYIPNLNSIYKSRL